ncbi:MAG: hypothetical protein QOI80_1964, partial [Solirubrobacteraceae bacterium]|nr:hypothetical protein [Solirubrobacteraceae bacterium]
VMDYGQALSEIARVLRPTGRTLHFFPSRWRPVEPHVRVPLATVLRGRPWLRLWAAAGVRNEFQAGLTARQVAELNRDYLRDQTNYLGRSALEEHFRRAFGHVEFVERLIFNTSGRRGAATLSRVPLAMRGYSALVARLVLAGHGDR